MRVVHLQLYLLTMGGPRFPNTTNIPHRNILRDNGKANGQTIYFSRNTISLEYSRGTESATVSDQSIILWKQMYLATVNLISVSDQDRSDDNFFAKYVREEIREVAAGMIESRYMDLGRTSLAGVENIVTTSGFRKLARSLNARVVELLLRLEVIQSSNDSDIGSEEYKAVFRKLKVLYDFKYKVDAATLAKAFMENNNITMRVPLNQGTRYTDFVTVIFRSKLTPLHKNSFLPMFTKYSADKNKDVQEAKRVEVKCEKADMNGLDIVYLSWTKSVVPPVKREAYEEKASILGKASSTQTKSGHTPSVDIQGILRRRAGEEYFNKLKDQSGGTEQKIDRKVFMDLVSSSDEQFTKMLVNLDSGVSTTAVSNTGNARNSYLEFRARNIARNQEQLLMLDLVTRKQRIKQ